jgi:L-rhamnose-H+ transport protein
MRSAAWNAPALLSQEPQFPQLVTLGTGCYVTERIEVLVISTASSTTHLFAIIIVLFGGMMTGSFSLPMKHITFWEWENIWGVYSITALLIIPWIVAAVTIPGLLAVYESVPALTLLLTLLFGFAWGISSVLFGVAIPIAGMALSFAIAVGLSAGLGSLIPLLLLTPARLRTASGGLIVGGLLLTLLAVGLLAVAGRGREKADRENSKDVPPEKRRSIGLGLLLCVLSGFLGPALNFSFAFGSKIMDQAVTRGAARINASHAVWAVSLLGGLISNAGYAAWKLQRNGTWKLYRRSGVWMNWALGALMGAFWTGGILLYGRGSILLGELGPAIGWPIFQATVVIVSSVLGALSGEWRNAEARFVWMNIAALVLLMLAIVVLSIGNRV